jgi:DNA-binding IclR family transcriptional regulator
MSKIVERTLDFIELFAAQQRPLTLSDLARLLGIPISSCHDVVQALQARGYLYEIGPRAGFYPTRRLAQHATAIAQADPLLLRAEARLLALRDAVDESVFLSKATGSRLAYLLVLEASHPLRFLVRVGAELRSLHATSAGKALLGSMAPEARRQVLTTAPLRPMTPHSVTDPDVLAAEIAASEDRGWFLNAEESVEGATTVSARFGSHRAVHVVTIAGPTARMGPKLQGAVAALVATCRELDAA